VNASGLITGGSLTGNFISNISTGFIYYIRRSTHIHTSYINLNDNPSTPYSLTLAKRYNRPISITDYHSVTCR
jgi:hypothetical protein